MRCFLAFPLAEELRNALADSLASAKKPTNVRCVAELQWHVTLVFLGDVEERRIHEIVRVCGRFSNNPGVITFNALETFPRERPRLIIASGAPEPRHHWRTFIEDLRRQCASFAPNMDSKPWRAHITLARTTEKHEELPQWSAPAGPWTWTPGGFILYESRLGSEGSVYRVIREFQFVR